MRAGCGADDKASMPGRDSRCVMYIPREWADQDELVTSSSDLCAVPSQHLKRDPFICS